MNRTKIEWTDYSWNPVTGCLHGCWYCYAKKLFTRFHRSFDPTFHPSRLKLPGKVKKPSKVFVCSVADLFAHWTPHRWRHLVIDAMKRYPWHTYQLLTKNPENISKTANYGKKNVWIGATVTSSREAHLVEEIIEVKGCAIRFVSYEPLLGEVATNMDGLDWIIVGKLTGSRRVKLQPEWVYQIIRNARRLDIPIFLKDNLGWPYKIQEWPKGIT